MDPISETLEAKMPADPEFRRRLFTGYGIGLAMLIMVPWQFSPLLKLWYAQNNGRTILFFAETASVLFLLCFIGPSLYIMSVGRRVLSEGRYPHSAMKVIFDTPIQRGKQAENVGRRLKLLGTVCIVAVMLGAGATHFLFYKFKNDPEFFLRH